MPSTYQEFYDFEGVRLYPHRAELIRLSDGAKFSIRPKERDFLKVLLDRAEETEVADRYRSHQGGMVRVFEIRQNSWDMVRSGTKPYDLHLLHIANLSSSLVQPQRFHRGGKWIAVEDWIDSLHDVGRNIKEVALILNGNQSPSSPIIHSHPKRFRQRAYCFDISLDAQVPKNQERREGRMLLQRGIDRNNQTDTGIAGNSIR